MKKLFTLLFATCFSVAMFGQEAIPAGGTWATARGIINTNFSLVAPKASPTFTGILTIPTTWRIGTVTITANGQELNILNGALVTVAELNSLVGVTSAIQTQLNGKSATSHNHSGTYEPVLGNPNTTGYVLSSTTAGVRSWIEMTGGTGGGYTNLTSFVDQTPWRVFYSNTNGDVTELALGANGTYLRSNGATSAPTFTAPSGVGDALTTDGLDQFASTTSSQLAGVLSDETGTGTVVYSSAIANFTTEPQVSAIVEDSINARLSGASVGISIADSTGNAPGNYVTRKALSDLIAANAGSAEGITLNGGTLTLEGADALTFVTGGNYSYNLPATSGGILMLMSEISDLVHDSIAANPGGSSTMDSTIVPLLMDSIPRFVFGAGAGLPADSVLFAKGRDIFGSFKTKQDSLYVYSLEKLRISSGDSLYFNGYYGNYQTAVAEDSLFTAPQLCGPTNSRYIPNNKRTIPPEKDVWLALKADQVTNKRPNMFLMQLNSGTIRAGAGGGGEAQNIILYSEDLTNATWNYDSSIDLTEDQANDLEGNATMELLTATNPDYHSFRQIFTAEEDTEYEISFDVIRGTLGSASCTVYEDGAPYTTLVNWNYYAETSGSIARISNTFTAGSTTSLVLKLLITGTSSGTIYLGRVQIRETSSSDEYVKTEATVKP